MLWYRLALLPAAVALISATPAEVDPRTISDAWPPAHYTASTAVRVIFVTSQDELDNMCGKAPAGKTKGGCTGHDAFGDVIVAPHPALTDAAIFRLVVAHELAHANGWPATHGD
jgi:hypothetical protein